MKATLHLLSAAIFSMLTFSALAQRVMPIGAGIPVSGIPGQDPIGVHTMVEYEDMLVIGGNYISFNGHVRNNIQGWDGGTQFYDMPGAFTSATDEVYAMELFGGNLVAAGNDADMGNVAQWDGSAWTIMGSGLPQAVRALAIYNGQLVASEAGHVHVWNGSDWEELGSGFVGVVNDLAVYNGELYAAGTIVAIAGGGASTKRLAKWNGSTWEQVLTGLNGTVTGMLSMADGLVLTGPFTSDGGGTLAFPSWTIYDGSQFVEEPTIGEYPSNVCAYPDGGFILGAGYGIWVHSGTNTYMDMGQINAAINYGGRTLVAGGGSSGVSYQKAIGIGEVLPGNFQQGLDVNNIRAQVNATPALFEPDYSPTGANFQGLGFEVPQGLGIGTIYRGAPWIVGYADSVLHTYSLYGGNELPYAGPFADIMDSAFYNRYHQVWKLDTAMINYHIAHWNDAGYQMPYVIATWPGNGNIANGEPAVLAPFADLNHNGYYEPAQGDYPLIRGDQAIYSIQHTVAFDSLHPGLPMDLHMMFYEYGNANDSDTWNTVFANIEVVNRSNATYTGVRFGMFMDFDIGDPYDDLAGCDSTLFLFDAYNGTDQDAEYGDQPPAQGVLFLNQPMTAHSVYNNGQEGTVDQVDLMSGLQNGQPFTQTGYPSHFQYPGGAFTDASAGNAPGDRRSVGSIGPYTLSPGDTLCVDLAFPYANAPSGGALASVGALKTRAHALHGWYDAQHFACLSQQLPTGITELDAGHFALYPNPTNGSITLERAEHGEQALVQVHAMSGSLVMQEYWRASATRIALDVSSLPAGIYAVEVRTQEGVQVRRLVKQ
ncbi:MAG: T9SS type A sorting domain-containing protein [Flavobacteriales bacterium]